MKLKRCPKCNCGAEFINKGDFYAEEAFAFTIGAIAGGLAEPFTHHGVDIGKGIYGDLAEDNHKRYKCTNPNCNYEWDEL